MSEPGHRVIERRMREPLETLRDLLKPGLRAVCVGINSSPASVRAGHYYQGTLGQRHFAQLLQAGALPPIRAGWQDDEAFAAGVGFTDIVKRPTASASEVRAEEFERGRRLLDRKLEQHRPRLVIFTFKKTAEVLFGRFYGTGFLPDVRLRGSKAFVMPGPYASAITVRETLNELREYFSDPDPPGHEA